MPTAYLVQYGRSAFVGRFLADDSFTAERGQAVVVRTVRGVEVGAVLCPADERFPGTFAADAGARILRTPNEGETAGAETLAAVVLADADRTANEFGLPVAFVDAEPMLDGPVILHVLPWAEVDLDSFLATLSIRHGRAVRLFDVSRAPTMTDAPEPATGCGKPGCGTGEGGSCGTGGGCSTGGCSRGKVQSAEELTGYFASLRQQMEAAGLARTPLN